jgi:hypothetical protein
LTGFDLCLVNLNIPNLYFNTVANPTTCPTGLLIQATAHPGNHGCTNDLGGSILKDKRQLTAITILPASHARMVSMAWSGNPFNSPLFVIGIVVRRSRKSSPLHQTLKPTRLGLLLFDNIESALRPYDINSLRSPDWRIRNGATLWAFGLHEIQLRA